MPSGSKDPFYLIYNNILKDNKSEEITNEKESSNNLSDIYI